MRVFDATDNDVLLQESYVIGFSKCTVNWFESYISIRSLIVNLGNNFSHNSSLSWCLPKGFISDMSQAVKCNLFLFVDELCFVCVS